MTSLVGGVERADDAGAIGLRLEGDDAGAAAAERADAVADVGADVEGELAGLHEAGVERVHGRVARGIAVVDVERAAEACEGWISFEFG